MFISRFWLRLSLLSLALVAFLGVIMRYKILFSLPFLHQKHLLHAHSTFGFQAWISHTLLCLLIALLPEHKRNTTFYARSIWANQLLAWSLLVVFGIQGYSPLSIVLAGASILNLLCLMWHYMGDMRKNLNPLVSSWFKAGFFYYLLAALGQCVLMGLMWQKVPNMRWYLAADFFYLHFLYNGWFFFGAMGLLLQVLLAMGFSADKLRLVFGFFHLSCIPTFLLSVLWVPLPFALNLLVGLFALLQLVGGGLFVWELRHKSYGQQLTMPVKVLWGVSLLSLCVRLCLQTVSTIPTLSHLAFGFRPIVIGYLHLNFLGIFTTFLLGYLIHTGLLVWENVWRWAVYVFVLGIVLNEVALMVQGVAAIGYMGLAYINHLLFVLVLVKFLALIVMQFGGKR